MVSVHDIGHSNFGDDCAENGCRGLTRLAGDIFHTLAERCDGPRRKRGTQVQRFRSKASRALGAQSATRKETILLPSHLRTPHEGREPLFCFGLIILRQVGTLRVRSEAFGSRTPESREV